ncbi:hypothetical protein ACFQ1E_07050 [Sphingomonas canadensis]|uniref:Uncharacterized protein n=1 Tax=Sphingomonas canadensis TaxID=1219257 RepID=A0ABW3H9V2_9SPHN|nr:hypothetical protein [Sphingomonas canadensis]MCW3835455.1 hypothetical protein [Sphingomonas canadensis]
MNHVQLAQEPLPRLHALIRSEVPQVGFLALCGDKLPLELRNAAGRRFTALRLLLGSTRDDLFNAFGCEKVIRHFVPTASSHQFHLLRIADEIIRGFTREDSVLSEGI